MSIVYVPTSARYLIIFFLFEFNQTIGEFVHENVNNDTIEQHHIADVLSDISDVKVSAEQTSTADATRYISMTSYIILLTIVTFLAVAIPLSLPFLFPIGLIITGNSWYFSCLALAFLSAFVVDYHFTTAYDFKQPNLSLPLRNKIINNIVVLSSLLSGMLFCVMTIVVFLSYDKMRLANVGDFAYGTPTPLVTLLIEIAVMSLMLPLAICSNEITDAIEDAIR